VERNREVFGTRKKIINKTLQKTENCRKIDISSSFLAFTVIYAILTEKCTNIES
jgi:hypothetical protein